MTTIATPYALPLDGTDTEVSLGWLMNPHEFARDCLRTRQRPLLNTWAVGAHMPEKFLRQMESPLVPNATGMTLLESDRGVLYPVIFAQSAGLQLRMLLCLADAQTQRWFRSVMASGTWTMALEVPETNQMAVLEGACGRRDRMEVERYIGDCTPLDTEDKLKDVAATARIVAEPSTMASAIPGFRVQDVRLVVLLGGSEEPHVSEPELAERVLN